MAAFVAWELAPAQSRAVSRHIARCADCRLWYREVLDLAEAWQDERELPDLDLVTPVLARLRAQAGTPAGRPASPWPRSLPGRVVFLHYAVAASMALVLFHLGVFHDVGDVAQHGAALSGQVTRLVQILARL